MRHLLRNLVIVCTAAFGFTSSIPAQDKEFQAIDGPYADWFYTELAKAPYAQKGDKGTVIYMLTYSSCPNCLVFLKDFYASRKNRIILRELFAPVATPPQALAEAADLALTRNPAVADAYYARTRIAPPVNTPERTAALNNVEGFFQYTIDKSFVKIGHFRGGYPTFIMKAYEKGAWHYWIMSGYTAGSSSVYLDKLMAEQTPTN